MKFETQAEHMRHILSSFGRRRAGYISSNDIIDMCRAVGWLHETINRTTTTIALMAQYLTPEEVQEVDDKLDKIEFDPIALALFGPDKEATRLFLFGKEES